MRFGHFSRQVIFRHDDASRLSLGPRQSLKGILPSLARAQIDARQPFCGNLHWASTSRIALHAADQRLRMGRRAARRVKSHALDNLDEFIRAMSGPHDAFESVAIGAIEEKSLLLIGPRRALGPLRIGQLGGEILGWAEFDVRCCCCP